MEESKNRSLLLTQIAVGLIGAALLALDIGCAWAVGWYIRLRGMSGHQGLEMMLTLYAGSVFAWLLLWRLWRLLGNLRAGRVFTEENVKLLRGVSNCCVAGALICLLGSLCYLPFLIVALAAGFMALIVRVVKNVFRQALDMKSELDLTI